MNMTTQLDALLKQFKQNPMYFFSLSSKELFHSNFLEFLFQTDCKKFFNIIDEILGTNFKSAPDDKYALSREKEKFDICISHKVKTKRGKEADCYDLIIENKVKSIPYKTQLADYQDKADKHNKNLGNHQVKILLLSLVKDFPDREKIEEQKNWTIAHYDQLCTLIRSEFSNHPTIGQYVKDYCDFLDLLDALQQSIINDNATGLFNNTDTYKPYRFHDIYAKLRSALFLMDFKQAIDQKVEAYGMKVKFVDSIHDVIIAEKYTPGIYLHYGINQGVGVADIWIPIWKDGRICKYEIVIQGIQYRHGYSEPTLGTNPQPTVEELWDANGKGGVEQDPFYKDFKYGNGIYSSLSESGMREQYCKYSHQGRATYLYTYLKIDKLERAKLLEIAIEDTLKLLDGNKNWL
jgi:hypothetical protein